MKRKTQPRIKRERLWATFSSSGYLATGPEGGLSVYCERADAEGDCLPESGDFVVEVRVLPVRTPKRKGVK